MYEAHPVFGQPQDEAIRVWRYMDFTKFVSLIDSRRLYFTRADKFDDPFEGSWPKMNVIARQHVPPEIPPEARENFRRQMTGMGEMLRNWPRFNAIDCWHMNDHESAAMWKLYLKSDEGIATSEKALNMNAKRGPLSLSGLQRKRASTSPMTPLRMA